MELEKKIKELVESAENTLEALKRELNDGQSAASSAMHYAEEAQQQAGEAYDYADTADDRFRDAQSEADTLEEYLGEINELLRNEGNVGDGSVSLDTQIKRYSPKIRELRSKGCDPDEIAKRLSVSVVLVNLVLERQAAA